MSILYLYLLFLFIFYYTLVSSKRSPPAARRKQIAMKSTRRPTKIPLAVESNILTAIIMPLKNKNIQFVLTYKCLHKMKTQKNMII